MLRFSENNFPLGEIYSISRFSDDYKCPVASPIPYDEILSAKVNEASLDVITFLDEGSTQGNPEILEKISKRVDQISFMESSFLKWRSIRLVSHIIEKIVPELPGNETYYFKKRRKKIISFVVDLPREFIYLFPHVLKKQITYSAYKKTTPAIAVPLARDKRCFYVLRNVSVECRGAQRAILAGLTRKKAALLLHELHINSLYECFRQSRLVFQYPKSVQGASFVRKVCTIENRYIKAFQLKLNKLSEKNQYSFVFQLVEGLALLHASMRVHCNISTGSAIYHKSGYKGIEAMWTDSGFSLRAGLDKTQFPLTIGFYGNIRATAPEILGNPCVDVAALLRAESWALGCCMYEWLFEKEPDWGGRIEAYFQRTVIFSAEERTCLEQQITASLDEDKRHVQAMASSDIKDLYQICFDLLDLDPGKRSTVPEIKDRMEERMFIDASFPPDATGMQLAILEDLSNAQYEAGGEGRLSTLASLRCLYS